MKKKRIVSGVRATGGLHLGNYIGAIKNWTEMATQHGDADFLFFIADLHAITTPYDEKALKDNTREIAAAYIAAGVDVRKMILFPQSAVPGHAMLQWLLTSLTPMGWLNRMTQFKEKAGKQRDNAVLGLYAYPVLQAADVLLYQATHVPVGEDQKQHIELARDIAGAFNRRYGQEFFTLPEPIIRKEGARIMSLRDGTKKMSKSDESDYSRINLMDDADTIALKFRKAKTDSDPLPDSFEALKDRPEAANLVTIYATLADMDRDAVVKQFAGRNFSVFKPALAELTAEKFTPVATRMRELLSDKAELDRQLAEGAERARAIAVPVLDDTMKLMGFWGTNPFHSADRVAGLL